MQNKQYINYIISEPVVEKQEILIAELCDHGFDGFEQTETNISANGLVDRIDAISVQSYLKNQGTRFTTKIIPEQNWNEQWEQSFEPIIVEKFCAVRAAFHQPVPGVQYDIIITPKMSFGTGHHATTYMMLQAMQQINFNGKTVIDFGTGTGILAILTEKLGAEKIQALDYDDWCIENGAENIAANNCKQIYLIKASDLEEIFPADIMLANINKHVILSNLPVIKQKLNDQGKLLISGILETDEQEVMEAASQNGFHKIISYKRNGWLCICFGIS